MKLVYMHVEGKIFAGLPKGNLAKLPAGMIEEFITLAGQELDYRIMGFMYHGWLFPVEHKPQIQKIAESYLEGDMVQRVLTFEKIFPVSYLPTIDGINLITPDQCKYINQLELPDSVVQVLRIEENTVKRGIGKPGRFTWSGRLIITARVRDRPDSELFNDWFVPEIKLLGAPENWP
jgi:hypothetical protein